MTEAPGLEIKPVNHRLPVELPVRRLDARATLPAYHSELAAGLDIAACLGRDPLRARPRG